MRMKWGRTASRHTPTHTQVLGKMKKWPEDMQEIRVRVQLSSLLGISSSLKSWNWLSRKRKRTERKRQKRGAWRGRSSVLRKESKRGSKGKERKDKGTIAIKRRGWLWWETEWYIYIYLLQKYVFNVIFFFYVFWLFMIGQFDQIRIRLKGSDPSGSGSVSASLVSPAPMLQSTVQSLKKKNSMT